MANKAMKAMTAKEFWEVLEGAGYSKSVWGYEGILNIISSHDDKEAEAWKGRGSDRMAEHSRKRADYIYDALSARGFYKA